MSRNSAYDTELKRLADDFEASIGTLGAFYHTPLMDVVDSARSLTRRMLETYESKDTDYSENDLPMGNLRESSELGIEPWRGVMVRIGDKKRRIGSFVKRASYLIKDEGVDDALVDLSNYALLGLVLYLEAKTPAPHYPDNWLDEHSKVDINSTANCFRQMAKSALICKLLFEYGQAEGVDAWKGRFWEEVLAEYNHIAQVSYREALL